MLPLDRSRNELMRDELVNANSLAKQFIHSQEEAVKKKITKMIQKYDMLTADIFILSLINTFLGLTGQKSGITKFCRTFNYLYFC